MPLNDSDLIRANYDRLAKDYADKLYKELQNKPLDRELLERFAGLVKDQGTVCDMGCGPGQIARYLKEQGAKVFGLDLSAGMVAQARSLNPDIHFCEGNMLALDLQDASLAGITAFYAIVNIPPDSLPQVFREMYRVLQPEGLLLLSFHIGDEVMRPEELWGRPVSMEFYHLRPERICRSLMDAGFTIVETVERDPYTEFEYQSRRAYVFARKPEAPSGA
jgi:ubiquinone/menaquinone biosynthesis C-methylase UbiE